MAYTVGMRFKDSLAALIAPLDADAHPEAVRRLSRCRRVADLERMAAEDLGWLESAKADPRYRLVKHNSGTFLVLSYDDGWGTTLVQQPFFR